MEFPNSKRLISKIYVDWAKCKIENYDSDKPDEPLVKAIQERLDGQDIKNFSYAELYEKAVSINKKQLSEKLIDLEKDTTKKVKAFLKIGN